MTVAFALFLSPEGIALAHRQPEGHWALIGETALDVPDLAQSLGTLRQIGEARGGEGFPTLLILPDDQVLYTDLDVHEAPGLDMRAEVASALDGRTPYAVGELAYDFSRTAPGRVRVAAVAQVTLTEAVDFARSAGFNGVGFAAAPPLERFPGVPIFEMMTGHAAPDLSEDGLEFGLDSWTGDAPLLMDPESQPAHTFVTEAPGLAEAPEESDEAPAAVEVVEAAITAPEAMPEEPVEAESMSPPDPVETRAEPEPDPEPLADLAPVASPDPSPPAIEPSDQEAAAFAVPASPAAPSEPNDDAPGTAAAFTSRRVATPEPPLPTFGTARKTEPEPDAPKGGRLKALKSRFGLSDADSSDAAVPVEDAPAPSKPARSAPKVPAVLAGSVADRSTGLADVEPEFEPAAPIEADRVAAFDSTPVETETPPAPVDDIPPGLPAGLARHLRARRGLPVPDGDGAEITAPAAFRGDIDPPAATWRPTPTAPSGLTAPQAGAATASDTLLGGGMLARRTDGAARPSLRTALVLTMVLILILALVAVWSALFLPESRVAQLLGRVAPEIETADDTGEVQAGGIEAPALLDLGQAPLAPGAAGNDTSIAEADTEDPAVPDGDAETLIAALPATEDSEPRLVPQEIERSDVAPIRPLPSLEAVEAEYAETRIWQLAPEAPSEPPREFLIPEATETFSLAALAPVRADRDLDPLPEAPLPGANLTRYAPPPPFGTRGAAPSFELVTPTPEGVLTPQGAFVVAGAPPVAAPPRPFDPEIAVAATPEAVTGPTPVPRPGEEDDTPVAEAEPETPAPLVPGRPVPRPTSVQEIALAAQAAAAALADAPTGSDLATGTSRVPQARPASIAAAATAARAAAVPDPEVEQVAPPTVEVDIPSNATVSRSATIDNAINLRDVNLIGVSGAPNDRRALVRLPSGRFLTVGVGDRMDGGRVAAIGPNSLQYIKNGRNITLEVPQG